MIRGVLLDNRLTTFLISILVVEVVLLSILYKDVLDFECASTGHQDMCLAISELPIRGLCVAALLAVLMISAPFRKQLSGLEVNPVPNITWICVHLAGLVMVAAPLLFLSNSISSSGFLSVLALWLIGAAVAGLGALFALIPPGQVIRNAASLHFGVWIAVLVAFLAPDWARLIQPIWNWEPITAATFNSVEFILHRFSQPVTSEPATRILGLGEFLVEVGYQCSGIEGLGLITLFFTVFVVLFRDTLDMRRVWLLLPIGLALSWIFNILRVSLLIWIGANVSPDLAINGFHSHAGWMFFAILSVGICFAANSIAWFRLVPARGPRTPSKAALSEIEGITAQILPFIVLMAAVLLRSTFAENPDDLYPYQFAALVMVLIYVSRYWTALDWRIDPIAVVTGLVIAGFWIFATPQEAAGAGDPSLFWVLTRVLGTILLIPIVEELFFRGYIIDKFRGRDGLMLALGVVVSAALFALLHDKWVLAGLAGLIFGWLVIRKGGRLTDAIVSHLIANAAIAGVAVYSGNWSLI